MDHQLKTNMISAAPLASSANEVWRDTYVSTVLKVVQRIEKSSYQVDNYELVCTSSKSKQECES